MRTKFLEIWNRFLMLLRREGLHGPIEWAGALFTVGLVGLIVWVKFATLETSHQKPLVEQKVRVVALASEANDRLLWQGRSIGGSTLFFFADAARRLSLGDDVCIQNAGGSTWSLAPNTSSRYGKGQRPQWKPCHGLPDVPMLD